MNRENFLKVMQACLLLYDDEEEEKVKELYGPSITSCATYIMNFVKGYEV